MLPAAAPIAAYSQYEAAVDIAIAPATEYQTAAPYTAPIAVVAQGRAPAAGDMGARPIYGIFCHWCFKSTMTIPLSWPISTWPISNWPLPSWPTSLMANIIMANAS